MPTRKSSRSKKSTICYGEADPAVCEPPLAREAAQEHRLSILLYRRGRDSGVWAGLVRHTGKMTVFWVRSSVPGELHVGVADRHSCGSAVCVNRCSHAGCLSKGVGITDTLARSACAHAACRGCIGIAWHLRTKAMSPARLLISARSRAGPVQYPKWLTEFRQSDRRYSPDPLSRQVSSDRSGVSRVDVRFFADRKLRVFPGCHPSGGYQVIGGGTNWPTRSSKCIGKNLLPKRQGRPTAKADDSSGQRHSSVSGIQKKPPKGNGCQQYGDRVRFFRLLVARQ